MYQFRFQDNLVIGIALLSLIGFWAFMPDSADADFKNKDTTTVYSERKIDDIASKTLKEGQAVSEKQTPNKEGYYR